MIKDTLKSIAGRIKRHRLRAARLYKRLTDEQKAMDELLDLYAQLAEEQLNSTQIPIYRTRSSPTGIGWVAVDRWSPECCEYVTVSSFRSLSEANNFIKDSLA